LVASAIAREEPFPGDGFAFMQVGPMPFVGRWLPPPGSVSAECSLMIPAVEVCTVEGSKILVRGKARAR
jgi:hypothetical protein